MSETKTALVTGANKGISSVGSLTRRSGPGSETTGPVAVAYAPS